MKRWLTVHWLSIWIVVFTAATAWANWTSYQNDRQQTEDRTHQAAINCVTGWEVREDIRDAISAAVVAGAEAIITVATEAEPDVVAAFRAEVTRHADAAAAEIPDPECDLEAAERLLEE